MQTLARALFRRPALTRAYDQKVIDHFERPRNIGALDRNDPAVGTGLVGAPACGDVMKLQIRVDDSGRITESAFRTFGCGSAIASSSLATEMIKGKTMEEASQLTNKQIASELKLPPVKLHCSMLAEDAIRAAVKDVMKKRGMSASAAAEEADKVVAGGVGGSAAAQQTSA